jgi:hypothetical protein
MAKIRLNSAATLDYGADWAAFKHWIDGTHAYLPYAWVEDDYSYTIVIPDQNIARLCGINKGGADATDFEATWKVERPLEIRAPSGSLVVQAEPRTGSKAQIISQNFCDKHTWYSTSIRRTSQTLTDSGNGLLWNLASPKVGVDVMHGRLPHERKLRTAHKPVVKVNGVTKTEKDAHTLTGDYTVNYATMAVTFDGTQAGATVTIDFSEVVDSKWYITPAEGKRLRLLSAELQFSTNARMDDSFVFQGRGDVAKHWALAAYWDENDGPYPAGTMLPLGDPTVYQTIYDLICEANKAYPTIPAVKHDTPTWRDSLSDTYIYAWDYDRQATIDITSGTVLSPREDINDIEISLEHDVEMAGDIAIVTFYCVSEDL